MPLTLSRRRLIARVALGTALVSAVWTGVLFFHSGFDTSLFGVRIRTNDPMRPMFLALGAIFLFVWAVGEGDADPEMSLVLDFPSRLFARLDDRLPAIGLAVAITVAGLSLGSKAAGGSDSYGYVSQAELWLSGHLRVDQPWVDQVPWPNAAQTFSPLGYQPGTTHATITPTYSPGLPMLMALAKLIGGQRAIFWVVPLCGGMFVFATFGIGRRLAGPYAGLIAAWLLATSPAFLFMLMAPMSDVPAAAAWTVTLWCATAGTLGGALAGGFAAALAVLIRPNLAPMAILPVLWIAFQARMRGPSRRRYLLQASAFLIALLPGLVITAVLNWFWNGSALRSGYGTVGEIFSVDSVLPNLKNYSILLSRTQTPLAFLGIAAVLVPARWLWPARARRSTVFLLGLFVLAIWAEYCAYRTFGAWWDLRFLLPASGFMMVGMGAVLLRVTRIAPPRSPLRGRALQLNLAVAFAAIVLGVRGLQFARQGGTFAQQGWETKYPIVAAIVAARTDPNAVIFSGLHSGSIRYYAGRTTLNYYNLDGAWLEGSAAWLNAHGAHPYALLDGEEVKDFKGRFWPDDSAGQAALKPSVVYDTGSKIYFFDLARAAGSPAPVETIIDPFPEVRCPSPVKPPVLVLR
jgi:hypothetical protein